MASKARFNQPPTGGKVGVTSGQCPKAVQVVGQNNDGLNGKRVLLLDRVEGLPKELYGFRTFEEVHAIESDNGKEVGCSGCSGTTVVHVGGN